MEMGKIVGKLVSDSSVQTTTGRLEQKRKEKENGKVRISDSPVQTTTGRLETLLKKKMVNDFPSLMTSDVS